MTPFYADERVHLYHGDARALIPHIEADWPRAVCITDPVWPNPGRAPLAGAEDPAGLFADVMGALVGLGLRRLIVILGVDSDPRFLAGVPAALPFVRSIWLRFARPSYKGPILVGAEVAYVFGVWGMAHKGQKVWPGEIVSTKVRDPWATAHPCPRKLDHLEGIVRGYTREEDIILDPFAGSGTTLAAAVSCHRRSVGLEVDGRWCAEIAARFGGAAPLFACGGA